MLNEKNILVLGSKKGSKLPNVKVDMIYSANGAAERALFYKKIYPDVPHTSIIGGKYFMECPPVKERVIKSKPDKLIVRFGPIEIPDELANNNCEIIQWDHKKDLDIQSQFYKFSWLDIVFGEVMFYEDKFLTRLRHFYRCIRHRGFLGGSTGFFAIFFAAMKHPNSNIITSGIGLVEGTRYYQPDNTYGWMSKGDMKFAKKKGVVITEHPNSNIDNFYVASGIGLNKFNNTSRFRVERFLAKRIKKLYKNKIISLDQDFVKNACGKLWQGETF